MLFRWVDYPLPAPSQAELSPRELGAARPSHAGNAWVPTAACRPLPRRRNLSQRVAGYSKKLTSEGDALADEVRRGFGTARPHPAPPAADSLAAHLSCMCLASLASHLCALK